MDPSRSSNPFFTPAMNSTAVPAANNSVPPRSLPLATRLGSLMAPTVNVGFATASAPPQQADYARAAALQTPMVDPIIASGGAVCRSDAQAMEAIAANLVRPGGVLESLLRCAPQATPDGAEAFLAKLLANASAAPAGASLDGVIGNGRSVFILFDGTFSHEPELPSHYAMSHLQNLVPSVKLTGSVMVDYPVGVDYKDGKTMFSEGWLEFVAAEKIVQGDLGLFQLTSPNAMSMLLYDCTGLEKPLNKRPERWDLFVAYPDDFPLGGVPATPATTPAPTPPPSPTPAGPGYLVPDYVRGMRYILGPRLNISEAIVERLAHVWLNFNADYPLYAVTMIKSHLTTGIFYFCTPFSEELPYMPKEVDMYFGSGSQCIRGKLKKRFGDGLARITKGWRAFVRVHDLQLDEVYVLCIKDVRGGIMSLRAFPVGQA